MCHAEPDLKIIKPDSTHQTKMVIKATINGIIMIHWLVYKTL